ncbi:MAG: DUF2085 domain-containing protein [Ignavibacteria bacterium]|nr:DUF2085 domain-containing protein [Ignavibacteria bacterium]
MKNKLIVGLLLFVSAVWIAGFSLLPFLPKDNSFQAFYPFLKVSYARVCHQKPDECFRINDSYFLVCARCTGIYIGAFFGFLFSLFSFTKYFRAIYKYFVVFSIIMFGDVLINNFLLSSYNKTSALFTGYLFSFFAVNFVIFEIKRNNFFHSAQRDI